MLSARFPMPWTAQEISLLIGLWPTASAAQISKWLNRSRGSVCGKAMRLRSHGVLPAEVEKHYEVKPVQTPHGPAKTTVTSIRPARPTPPIDATVPPPDMRRCSLVELDDGQCRHAPGRDAVLRRRRGARVFLLRASSADGAMRQWSAATRSRSTSG